MTSIVKAFVTKHESGNYTVYVPDLDELEFMFEIGVDHNPDDTDNVIKEKVAKFIASYYAENTNKLIQKAWTVRFTGITWVVSLDVKTGELEGNEEINDNGEFVINPYEGE